MKFTQFSQPWHAQLLHKHNSLQAPFNSVECDGKCDMLHVQRRKFRELEHKTQKKNTPKRG